MKTNRASPLGEIAISATTNYLPIGPLNCLSIICTRIANYRFTPLLISFRPFFLSPISLACLHRTHTQRMHMQHTRFTISSLRHIFVLNIYILYVYMYICISFTHFCRYVRFSKYFPVLHFLILSLFLTLFHTHSLSFSLSRDALSLGICRR